MTPAEQIDALIASLTDWRGTTLASIRSIILAADPEIAEEWKWLGSPVWSRDGNIVVGNAHKDKVKLTFAHGASRARPGPAVQRRLQWQGLASDRSVRGRPRRWAALQTLIRAAVAFNQEKLRSRRKPARAQKV